MKYQSANDTSVLEVAVEISVSRSSDLEKTTITTILIAAENCFRKSQFQLILEVP